MGGDSHCRRRRMARPAYARFAPAIYRVILRQVIFFILRQWFENGGGSYGHPNLERPERLTGEYSERFRYKFPGYIASLVV